MSFPFAGMPGFQSYLSTVDPNKMRADLPSWPADPTDITAFADIARTAGHIEHALVFYRYALDQFENDPSKIAADTNLTGAYYIYGKTLLETGRPLDAIHPLSKAAKLSPKDAATWFVLASAYVLVGRLEEAHGCMARAVSLEGVDMQQDAAFFRKIRGHFTGLEEELRRQGRAGFLDDPADASR